MPKPTSPSQPKPNQLLTQEETAELLGVEPRTLEAWRARGSYSFPFIRIGRRIVRYRQVDVERWIQERLVEQGTAT